MQEDGVGMREDEQFGKAALLAGRCGCGGSGALRFGPLAGLLTAAAALAADRFACAMSGLIRSALRRNRACDNPRSAKPLPLRAALTALLFLALGAPGSAGAVELVTNKALSSTTASNDFQAQSFMTGADAGGYTVSSIAIRAGSVASGETTAVTIREDSGGEPGTVLATLSNPASLSGGFNTFAAPANTILAASTTYWVYVNDGIADSRIAFTTVAGDTDTGAAGWSIGNSRVSRSSETDSWSAADESLVITVNGEAVTPPDATLSALALGAGVALSPAFDAATKEYRAWVANSVASVTVTATGNDDGATVAIAGDDDTATPDTATISLDAGRNTITVTVTNGSATETYTAVVVRAAAAPTADPAALLTANVTAGNDSTGNVHGFSASPAYGAMTGRTFEVDGTTYGIDTLALSTGADLPNFAANEVGICFDTARAPDDAVRNRLVLGIGSHEIALSDSVERVPGSECHTQARPAGLDAWAWGDVALVKLDATNRAATGAPTVSGTAKVGEELTANMGNIGDPDGLPDTYPDDYDFQWVRVDGSDETDITGATAGTYTLAAADEGRKIKVRVSFTDDGGDGEALTSAAYPAGMDNTVAASGTVVLNMTVGNRYALKAGGARGPETERGYRRQSCVEESLYEPPSVSGLRQDVSRYDTCYGSMTDRSFTHEGTSYTIRAAVHYMEQGTFELEFTRAVDIDALDGVTFQIQDTTFAVSERHAEASGGSTISWVLTNWDVDVRHPEYLPPLEVVSARVTGNDGGNGAWEAGETVTVEVAFSRAVRVEGDPAVGILLDGARRDAALASGPDKAQTHRFEYTVTDADAGAKVVRVVSNSLTVDGAGFLDDLDWTAPLGFSTPGISVADVTVAEGPGATAEFTVTLAPAADEQVRVAYATVDGTAVAGEDYEMATGTVTFAPGVTQQTVSVRVYDDDVEDAGETFALVLSNPQGSHAYLARTRAAATVDNDDAGTAPLTAGLTGLPAGHGGAAFTFELAFSETLGNGFSYKALAGVDGHTSVLSVTGGQVTKARRVAQGADRNRRWLITVAPDAGAGAVTVTLPAAADCATANALCTADGRGLSADVTATVPRDAPADTPAAPFTVRFEGVPAEHDGTAAVTFRVAFSKNPEGYSYVTMRDETLAVRQGAAALDATRVRRLNKPLSDRWEVTVTPVSRADMTVRIGPFSSCTETGAVCAANDEVLANAVSWTIQGPPGLSVADARVDENTGDPVVFAVTLGRASRHTVTVDYATSDGTGSNAAVAGQDYEARSGTLTFAPGETDKTVSVPVLPDSHDEGEETFTLTLSNPAGGNAWLADAVAAGTIVNTDPMPQAWLARFGRTVAEQVIGAVEGRFAAQRTPGIEVRVAGYPLEWGATGSADLPSPVLAQPGQAPVSGWLKDRAGPGSAPGRAAVGPGGQDSRSVTARDLLMGTSFALTAGALAGGTVSVWGHGAMSRFDGRAGDLTLDGEVASVMLGADWSGGPGSKPGVAPVAGRGAWTAGLLVSRADGTGSYRDAGAGGLAATLTGLWPYGRYQMGERLTLWGVAGVGEGALELAPEGQAPLAADLDLAMAATGLRGVVLAAPASGGVEVAVTSDALAVRTSSEKVAGLAATDADVTRLRLGLEGTWRGLEAGGGALAPRLEVGVRHDGGDAETGFGLDLGGGLAWSHPASGLSAELSGRGLLTHESRGFRDRGLAGSFAWDPGQGSGHGPRLTLTRSIGSSSAGGVDALLRRETLSGLAPGDLGAGRDDLANRHLELRFGYGLPAFGHRFTSTPEAGVGLANGRRDYTLGWRLNLVQGGAAALECVLNGTRREATGANDHADPEHGVGLRLTARW